MNKNNIPHKCYMLYIDKDGDPDHAITHSFIIADGMWYEDSAYPLRGIHKNYSPDKVAHELNDKMYRLSCNSYIWEYNPGDLDNYLSPDEYMDKVTEKEPIIEDMFS